jgi:hypothetical protein
MNKNYLEHSIMMWKRKKSPRFSQHILRYPISINSHTYALLLRERKFLNIM